MLAERRAEAAREDAE
jgi:ribonuclease VapC